MIEDAVGRVAKFFNTMQAIERGDDNIKALTDMIIDMHKKQLEHIDLQLVHWLTLKLTKQQQEAVSYCQEQVLNLYRLQALLENGLPGKSGHELQ